MVWPSVEFGLNLLMFLDSLSRSLMVIPCAAPRSAWMGGFLSFTGKSSVRRQVRFWVVALHFFRCIPILGCGALLCSAEVRLSDVSLALALVSAHKHVSVLFWPCRADRCYRLAVGSDCLFQFCTFQGGLQGTDFSILVTDVILGFL